MCQLDYIILFLYKKYYNLKITLLKWSSSRNKSMGLDEMSPQIYLQIECRRNSFFAQPNTCCNSRSPLLCESFNFWNIYTCIQKCCSTIYSCLIHVSIFVLFYTFRSINLILSTQFILGIVIYKIIKLDLTIIYIFTIK